MITQASDLVQGGLEDVLAPGKSAVSGWDYLDDLSQDSPSWGITNGILKPASSRERETLSLIALTVRLGA